MADLQIERAVQAEFGVSTIVGVDEAGRGALAGPVVAGVAVLPIDDPKRMKPLLVLNDSKQISAKKREAFFDLIVEHALGWAVGKSRAAEIDELGIIPATRQAMTRALKKLDIMFEYLLIDGRIKLPDQELPQKSVIKGDALSLSIAAGSILAKVARDRLMVAAAADYPTYQFAQHKGYGTQAHRDLIEKHGPCAIHRHTFAPIREDNIMLS